MVPKVRGHRGDHVGNELVFEDGDHRGADGGVRQHRGLDLPQLDAGAPHLHHRVAAADDLQVPGLRPDGQVARARRAGPVEGGQGREERLRGLLGQAEVPRGEARTRHRDLADGPRPDAREAFVQDRAALPHVRPPGAHDAAVRGAPLDVLAGAHLDRGDVALLGPAVARVKHAILGQRGQGAAAEVGRHGGAADADVRHVLRQAVLQKDVEHGGHETGVGRPVLVGEGLQLRGLDHMRAAVGEVQATTARQQRREEVVNEGHPSR
mmetsp:Transcript_37693/g.113879  ORF Transcript_37693/g.113879 Transcript_37693/m.113879 type:complete len:266 (-) Transcript_37693:488-1285(-)